MKPGAPATAALPSLLIPRIREVLDSIEAAQHSDDIEVWHRLRVAIARLRTALSAFGSCLQGVPNRRLDHELRWLRRQCAALRDWNVFAGSPACARHKDPRLARAASTRLDAAAIRARRALQQPRCDRLVRQLHALQDTLRWSATAKAEAPTLAELAEDVLQRRMRKLHKRGRHLESMRVKDLHRLRLAVKKLRYTAELFQCLYAEPTSEKRLRKLKKLQDVLGTIQDRSVAYRLAMQLAHAAGAEASISRRSRPNKALRRALRSAWAAVEDLSF